MLGAAWVAFIVAALLLGHLFSRPSVGPAFAVLFYGVWIVATALWVLVLNTEYPPGTRTYIATAAVLFIGMLFPLIILGGQILLFFRSPGRYLRPTNPECGDLVSRI